MRVIAVIVRAGIVVGLGALAASTVATRIVPVARCGLENCRTAGFVMNLRRYGRLAVATWRDQVPDTERQGLASEPAGEDS